MNFENLLIPVEPAEEAVSSDKSLDKIIGRLKLLSVNYQSLQLRMNGTDSAIKNQLIVYNAQLVQILNDLQKLPKNATESFIDIAEEGLFSGLKARREARENEKKLDENAHDWFERQYGNKICSILSKYSATLYSEIVGVVKQTERDLGSDSVFKVYKETLKLEYIRPAFSAPVHDYSIDLINVDCVSNEAHDESEFEKNIDKDKISIICSKIQSELNKSIPLNISVKLIDGQPDICYNISAELKIGDLLEKYNSQNQ